MGGVRRSTDALSSEAEVGRVISPSTVTKEDSMDHKEAYDMLCKVGFTASEIDRLQRLQRDYAEKKSGLLPADRRRLEFVRWLVTTGRLTDQVA